MAARQVPADLAEALRANPGALRTFEGLPPEAQAQWVRWVERGRPRRVRARRVAETVRRLGAYGATAAASEETVAERPPPPPPSYVWVWLLLLLLLVIAGLLAWFFATRGNGNKVNVPRVVGMSLPQARVQLHRRGLIDVVNRVASQQPPNTVVAQAPRAGTNLSKGSSVRLNVSNAPKLVVVPDVVGLQADTAERRLATRKLVPNEQGAFSKKPAGTVIAMKPVAGKQVKPGSTVTVTVSHGRGKVAVPLVVGESAAQATTTLRKADLVPHAVQVPSNETKGTVVAQDPKQGQKVPRGTTVRMNVSNGAATTTTQATTTTTAQTTTKRTTTTRTTTTTTGGTGGARTQVPNVVGLQFTQAMKQLANAGFHPLAVYATSTRPKGTVTTEKPSGGTTAKKGSAVHVTVSAGPSESVLRAVPDVTGEDEQSARSDLQSAGFKVLVLQRRVTDQTEQGTVVDEQPAGADQAPAGGYVAIFVGSTASGQP